MHCVMNEQMQNRKPDFKKPLVVLKSRVLLTTEFCLWKNPTSLCCFCKNVGILEIEFKKPDFTDVKNCWQSRVLGFLT